MECKLLLKKIVFFFVIVILAFGCSSTLIAIPVLEQIPVPEGTRLEQRVNRYFNGRPEEVYSVYRDSSGNFLKHGVDFHYFKTGQIEIKENYLHGKLAGISEFWYQNGSKQGELNYSEGKPDGKAISWHANGIKKSEKTWTDGKLNGTEMEWDKKGKLIKKLNWNQNALVPR